MANSYSSPGFVLGNGVSIKKKPFSALVHVTPLGRPDLIHSLSGRLDPGSVYFFQTCEARVLVIMHNRS
jgi:hypothetical protein